MAKHNSSYRHFSETITNQKSLLFFQTELQNGKASSSYRYFSETIMNQKSLLIFKQSCKMAKFLRVIGIFQKQ